MLGKWYGSYGNYGTHLKCPALEGKHQNFPTSRRSGRAEKCREVQSRRFQRCVGQSITHTPVDLVRRLKKSTGRLKTLEEAPQATTNKTTSCRTTTRSIPQQSQHTGHAKTQQSQHTGYTQAIPWLFIVLSHETFFLSFLKYNTKQQA